MFLNLSLLNKLRWLHGQMLLTHPTCTCKTTIIINIVINHSQITDAHCTVEAFYLYENCNLIDPF